MITVILTYFRFSHSQYISLSIDTSLHVVSELGRFSQNQQQAIVTG